MPLGQSRHELSGLHYRYAKQQSLVTLGNLPAIGFEPIYTPSWSWQQDSNLLIPLYKKGSRPNENCQQT